MPPIATEPEKMPQIDLNSVELRSRESRHINTSSSPNETHTLEVHMFGLKKTLSGGTSAAYRQEIGGTWNGYKKTQSGMASGLVAGTEVATVMGWRPVEAIAEGDLVLTFDRGLQAVRKVTRGALWASEQPCPKSLWPLHVPEGAIGNLDEMTLLPEQSVLVESDTADLLFDDPFALISASDLEGLRGIERVVPFGDVDVIQLQFESDEVIFAGSGALIYCPMLNVVSISDLIAARVPRNRYMSLSRDEAADLVDCLQEEDAMSAMNIPEPAFIAQVA